ncbi:MAG: hypothetical protein ACPLPS_10010 [bacterium]
MKRTDIARNNNTIEQVNIVKKEVLKKALETEKKLIEELLEGEIEEILPQRYAKKRGSEETGLFCPHSGPRKTGQVRRNGHYKRKLRVTEGIIEGLREPMIECSECGRKI